MKIQKRRFVGGYAFKRFQGAPKPALTPAEPPGRVVIPLKQGAGQEVPPLVRPGDRVKAGQIIGREDSLFSNPVHASVAGTVLSIKELEYNHERLHAVEIEAGGTDQMVFLPGASSDWHSLASGKIEELIYLSGGASLGSAGIPTSFKSAPLNPAEVEHLIVHFTEAEVYNPALEVLFQERGLFRFIEGLRILKKILPKAHLHLVLSRSGSSWFAAIREKLKTEQGFTLYQVKPKFPFHHTAVLSAAILGQEVVSAAQAAARGIIALDIQAVLSVYTAVTQGLPLIERTVILAGPGFSNQTHLKVRVGTLLSDVLAQETRGEIPFRLVLNSVLTGALISDGEVPLARTDEAVIALEERNHGSLFSFARPGLRKDSYSNTFCSLFIPLEKETHTNIQGEKRACLSCGFCADCCPVRILPQVLHKYVARGKVDATLIRYKIFSCLECNLCSYVCPAKIPVAALLKRGKEELISEGFYNPEEQERRFAGSSP